jgi:hypothetical protein
MRVQSFSTGPVASPLLLLSIRAGIGFAKKIQTAYLMRLAVYNLHFQPKSAFCTFMDELLRAIAAQYTHKSSNSLC